MQTKLTFPDKKKLFQEFERHHAARVATVRDLESLVEDALGEVQPRPMVKGRAKCFTSFFRKTIRLFNLAENKSFPPPVNDLIGIRVVCPFIEALIDAESALVKAFKVKEIERKGSGFSFKEFGYDSTHILIFIPDELRQKFGELGCGIAEVQLRTILQDAWAEVEHELVYKAEFTPFDVPMKRKLAAVNASLALADIVFQEIRDYQRQLNRELGKRRESFFQKIEESTDDLIFKQQSAKDQRLGRFRIEPSNGGESIDDMLLDALYAHNNQQLDQAIKIYSRILNNNPNDTIKSVIYKHRGMAHFAQSLYEEAASDFAMTRQLDRSNYKAAYYEAVVRSVQQRYHEAIEDFSIALSINPYHYYSFFRRAQAHFHIGDLPKALADCEEALAMDPASVQARRFRDIILKQLDN